MSQYLRFQSLVSNLASAAKELEETVNMRDRGARLKELEILHRNLGFLIERMRDEHFRLDPQKGLHRALLRYGHCDPKLTDSQPYEKPKQ